MSAITDTEPHVFYFDYMGTSLVLTPEPAFCFELRLTRCYELAGMAVTLGDLAHGTLVHGSIHGRDERCERIGHAWVVFQEDAGEPLRVWEPITGKVYDLAEWYEFARAEEERRYEAPQAAALVVQFGHWGRFHESEWP